MFAHFVEETEGLDDGCALGFEVELEACGAEGGGALDDSDVVGGVGSLEEGCEGGAADAGADDEDVEGHVGGGFWEA